MKQTTRRRIPAAALVAAVLVIALAGTALAAGYLGRVRISQIDDYCGNSGDQKGYGVDMPDSCIPVASLSEEVLAACPGREADNSVRIPFGSRPEAEAFLGLDLADNAEWEEANSGTNEKRWGDCITYINYSPENLPANIIVSTSYNKANCLVCETVQCSTDAALPGPDPDAPVIGVMIPVYGENEFQEYVTANGIESTIYKETVTETLSSGSYERTRYTAHFIKNNSLYTVDVYSSETWKIDRESMEFLDPWDTLIEVLDAYE